MSQGFNARLKTQDLRLREEHMSSYHLTRFLFDLKMDESLLKRASEDFEGVMSGYDLTPEEKQALRAGDPTMRE